MTQRLDVDVRVLFSDCSASTDEPIAFYAVEHGDSTLYLCNLAVAKRWRRRGVGTAALESASRFGKDLGYRFLELDVQEENLPAQLLYRKLGFRAVEVKPHFYRDQAGYNMLKEL
ncbi:MAG: GNAT family N-acetyltransferase [Verrucomicrobiota bacterium]